MINDWDTERNLPFCWKVLIGKPLQGGLIMFGFPTIYKNCKSQKENIKRPATIFNLFLKLWDT